MEQELKSMTIDSDQLLDQAQQETGLKDFSWSETDSAYKGFKQLLEPHKEAYPFTAAGKDYFSRVIVDALKNRLYLAQLLKEHPEILEQQVDAPMFVTGMPRSGTTLLQNLLACDDNRRALKAWETQSLDPNLSKQDKISAQQTFLEESYELMHKQKKIHYVDAQGPEECGPLLRSTFSVPFVFQLFNRNMDFTIWHFTVDHKETYDYFKTQLQALQYLHKDSNRWSLKSPLHIFYGDSLFKTFPDARLIITHRDPRKVLPSTVSLGLSSLTVLTEIEEDQYPEYAATTTMQSEFATARTIEQVAAVDESVVINIQYNDLMDDPIETVKHIYKHFDEPVSELFVKNMQDYLEKNPQHKFGKHEYSLDQYNISEEYVMKSFETYIEAFGVKLGL